MKSGAETYFSPTLSEGLTPPPPTPVFCFLCNTYGRNRSVFPEIEMSLSYLGGYTVNWPTGLLLLWFHVNYSILDMVLDTNLIYSDQTLNDLASFTCLPTLEEKWKKFGTSLRFNNFLCTCTHLEKWGINKHTAVLTTCAKKLLLF